MGRGHAAEHLGPGTLGPAATSDRVPRTPLTCRLRVALPNSSWMGRLTGTHLDVRIEVLDRLPLPSKRMLTVVRLHESSRPDWSAVIRRFPGVNHVQRLDRGSGIGIYRVTARAPTYLSLFQRLRITRRYPFWVENGIANWIVTGSNTQIRRLIAGLKTRVPSVLVQEIRPVYRDRVPKGLTPRQGQFFQTAIEQGYYEVPRGVTLTSLANQLQISKATLSKTLAIAEQKLLTSAASTSV
jgi:predicted DNA binding protein